MPRIAKKVLPDWVIKYERKGHKVEDRNGKYYLFKVSCYYSKKEKKNKVKKEYLGSLYQGIGLISPKQKGQIKLQDTITKTAGCSNLLMLIAGDIYENLSSNGFDADLILTIAYIRLLNCTPLSRVGYSYDDDMISQIFPNLSLSKSSISEKLGTMGKFRDSIVNFMKSYIADGETVLFDGTTFISNSENLEEVGTGYDHHGSISDQFGVLFGFSLEKQEPIYYRNFDGSERDIKPFKDAINELHLQKVDVIADNGFFNKDLLVSLKETDGIRYLIPLKRNNHYVTQSILDDTNHAAYSDVFTYHKRAIYVYNAHKNDKEAVYIFVDTMRKSIEETSLVEKYEKGNITTEEFNKKKKTCGMITISSNIFEKDGKQIYLTYKVRNQVEKYIDSLKNTLKYDKSSMQESSHLEGWSFLNHITTKLSYRIGNILNNIVYNEENGEKKYLSEYYSIHDTIAILQKHKKTKMLTAEDWVDQESPSTTEKIEKMIVEKAKEMYKPIVKN
jgi:hypothetical protein